MGQDMNYNEVLTRLVYLTKRNNITQTEIGEAINVERRAINGRAERNSKFKQSEIDKIESSFDVDLSIVSISDNSGERQNDTSVDEKSLLFGKRLSLLQEKYNFLDREMAILLNLSEKDYIKLITGKIKPDSDILNKIKQNFKISIDYLLYGE